MDSSTNDGTKPSASASMQDLMTRLARIRQIIDRVGRNSERPTESDRMLAVIGYDWSVETLLKTVILTHNAEFDVSNKKLKELWAEASRCAKSDPARKQGIPPFGGIHRVRSIRNEVQHDGVCPSKEEVNECRQAALDFVTDTVEIVWHMDFRQITAAGLIRNDEARTELQRSEWGVRKTGPNAPLKAAQKARRVLENVLRRVAPCVVGPEIGSPNYDADSHEMRRVKLAIGDVQRSFLLHALGLDYLDYLRISRLTGQFELLPQCPDGAYAHEARPISENDAEFVIEYCTDAVLSIEEAVSDLQYPFGLDPEGIDDSRRTIEVWRPAQPECIDDDDTFVYAGHDSSEEPIHEDYSQIPPDYDGNVEV